MPLPRDLLAAQDGVLSRAQLAERGLGDAGLRRLVRRRELVRVHPGVYVAHTGPLSWLQRAWAAVLALRPAALSHDSALRAHGLDADARGTPGRLHVAVDRLRSVTAPVGVRVHHRTRLADHALWNLSPPRVRLEDAVLDVAADEQGVDAVVAALAAAVQSGRTTDVRLREALRARPRLPRRRLIAELLGEVGTGVRSPLELRYRRDVQRAHGLPRGAAQVPERVADRLEIRDVVLERFGLVIELDGRLGHADPLGRAADLSRDLRVAAGQRLTLRLGWRQVAVEPCATAWSVGEVLRARGWRGSLRRCPACGDLPWIPVTR